MDYDEYQNLLGTNETQFNSSIQSPSPEQELKILILSTAKVVACSIGFLTDFFIIFILCKYKNLKTPTNLYIMHWLISDALFLFCDPAEYYLYRAIKHHNIPRPYICVIFSSSIVTRIAEVTFMAIVLMHVYFENHPAQFFVKHCKNLIAIVWVFTILVIVCLVISCTLTVYDQSVGSLVLAVTSSVSLVSFIGVHMKRRFANPYKKGDRVSLALALLTTYAICWMVYIICSILTSVLYSMFHIEMIIEFIMSIVHLYPLLFLYLFHLLDPKFSTCVNYLFKKKNHEEVVI